MTGRFAGYVYHGESTRRIECTVSVNENGLASISHGRTSTHHKLTEAKITERIGNTPRWITFADGVRVETTDNDALDAVLSKHDLQKTSRRVYQLESSLKYAVTALIVAVGITFAFVRYGLPPLSNYVAHQVPVSYEETMGTQALALVDKLYFTPSKLDSATRERLTQQFNSMASGLTTNYNYRLEFRASNIGANAFALPSGIAVMTDELVELADSDDEVIAVLAHELGHLEHRHTLRSVIQNSAAVAIMASITGDVTSVTGLGAAIPTILFEAKNSRDFEREADQFAIEQLKEIDIAPSNLATILEKLDRSFGGDPTDDETSAIDSYLSSHPATAERLETILNASQPGS